MQVNFNLISSYIVLSCLLNTSYGLYGTSSIDEEFYILKPEYKMMAIRHADFDIFVLSRFLWCFGLTLRGSTWNF